MLGLGLMELLMLMLAAMLTGFSKTAVSGATLPAVALVAYSFGGKLSAGIMLTMLMVADLFGVYNYGKYGKLKDLIRILPPAIAGVFLGAAVGSYLNDAQFKFLIGVTVIFCLVLLIYMETIGKNAKVPSGALFHGATGIVNGFASMVGNAASPIFSVYMLSLGFTKNKFIGTAAWFFFIVNIVKFPFHVFLWKTITLETARYTLYMLPFIVFGAALGVFMIKRVSEKTFKYIVIGMTALAALRLMV